MKVIYEIEFETDFGRGFETLRLESENKTGVFPAIYVCVVWPSRVKTLDDWNDLRSSLLPFGWVI